MLFLYFKKLYFILLYFISTNITWRFHQVNYYWRIREYTLEVLVRHFPTGIVQLSLWVLEEGGRIYQSL